MATPSDDDFLDPTLWMGAKEVAGVLGIHVQSVYNKISTGEDFPVSYTVGTRKTRFFKPEVKAWLMKRRRVSAAVKVQQLTEARA